MSLTQDRLVAAATVLAESVWLYAVLALVGLLFGRGGSPLSWIAVLAILTTSFVVARTLAFIRMPATVAYAAQMVAGVLALYLTLATQVPTEPPGAGLGWAGALASGRGAEGSAAVAVLGAVFGVGLWWRGGRLVSPYYPVEDLGGSFRLGVAVLAVAAVVDMFHSVDLNIFPLMFLFFAAALAGLGAGHIVPASRKSEQKMHWARLTGGVVALVLMVGFLFSLLRESVLSFLSGPALAVLNALATVVFYVVMVPLGFLVGLLMKGVWSFIRWISGGQRGEQPLETLDDWGETLLNLQEQAGEGSHMLLHVMQWTLLAIAVLVALYLLSRAFRRRIRWRRMQTEGTREPVAEDADPAADMAQLLLNLIRRRSRRSKPRHAYALPEDEPGVVEVFRVYFGLVALAEERGFPRPPHETPTEFQRTLERLFPPRVVRTVTTFFNRACYGHHPAPLDQILEMRASVKGLTSKDV